MATRFKDIYRPPNSFGKKVKLFAQLFLCAMIAILILFPPVAPAVGKVEPTYAIVIFMAVGLLGMIT